MVATVSAIFNCSGSHTRAVSVWETSSASGSFRATDSKGFYNGVPLG
jgi:hypothetical protein